MKYEIGDKVKIKTDLIAGTIYGDDSIDFTNQMIPYKGKEATIIKLNRDNNYYCLDIDKGYYFWSDEMFENKMITAIDKAWEDNLKLNIEDQWASKQDIMENYCPNSIEIGLNLNEPKECPEGYDYEICNRCWNREVKKDKYEEDLHTLDSIENKSTFERLEISPIKGIEIGYEDEEDLLIGLTKNQNPISMNFDFTDLKYDNIPELIAWLQSVYNYCTELKNTINFVDWQTARNHMEQGNKTKYKNITHIIKDGDLCYIDKTDNDLYIEPLDLEMLDSKEWILL